MHYYGVDKSACKIIASYFKGRYHRVKIGIARSEWLELTKGAPQGSIMGPFSYNVHSNDLIMLMAMLCDIFNYADDNTVCCYGKTLGHVKSQLEIITSKMLHWFKINEMKVNPDKFQLIIFNKNGMHSEETIKVGDSIVSSQNVVKLLGVLFDKTLTFNAQVDELCRKAGRKLNVLGRLSKTLDTESKLVIFQSFILTHFEYCPVIWHFCSRKKNEESRKDTKTSTSLCIQ
jgi:hypothetical protein